MHPEYNPKHRCFKKQQEQAVTDPDYMVITVGQKKVLFC